jgi:predicted small integral membrane protein
MTPDAATVLTARSQPNVVELLVLGAASVGLAYVGLMAFDTGVRMIGPYRLGRPPQDLAVFFLFLAAMMFAVTVWQIRRRLVPNVDVVADADGIASQQSFWGRGRLAWSEITGLESKYPGLLYIRGISATGDTKRLVIDTRQIDVPAADLYEFIARYRPDLVSKPRS